MPKYAVFWAMVSWLLPQAIISMCVGGLLDLAGPEVSAGTAEQYHGLTLVLLKAGPSCSSSL